MLFQSLQLGLIIVSRNYANTNLRINISNGLVFIATTVYEIYWTKREPETQVARRRVSMETYLLSPAPWPSIDLGTARYKPRTEPVKPKET